MDQGSAPRPHLWGNSDAQDSVAAYDLEVSEDGADWTRLLTSTQATSYEHAGEYGHSYTFRARATDNVSNTGDWAEAATAVVQVTKYYHFGGQRVAMRQGDVVYYLHSDHLGSTSVASTGGGALHSRQLYYPYGETRYASGGLPTDFGFTGQRSEGFGLYDYHARYYSPYLGRFISADTIVPEPGNPQEFNRYSYVLGNPLLYVDPSGHQGDPWWKKIVGAADSIATTMESAAANVASEMESLAVDVVDSLGLPDSERNYRATCQAMALVAFWFTEEPYTEVMWFGPDSLLTEEVMYDPAVDEFRGQWAASDYELPFTWSHERDEKTGFLAGGAKPFFIENVELFLSLIGLGSETPEGRIDAVGGVFGSFDSITVFEDNGMLRFEVYNTMGLASFTRIPGTDRWLIDNRARSDPGPGGTIEQYFYWWEPTPCPPYCSSFD